MNNQAISQTKSNSVFYILCIPLVADAIRGVVREVVDKGTLIVDINQRDFYSSQSNYSQLVSVFETILICFLLLRIFVNTYIINKQKYEARTLTLVFSITVIASSFINYSQWPIERLLQSLMFVLAINIISINDIRKINFLKFVSIYRIIFYLSVSYFIVFRDSSFNACRADKCSIFGQLNNSFFLNEQSYAIFLLILFSLELGIGVKRQRFTLLLAVIFLISTGSRSGILAFTIITLIFLSRFPKRSIISFWSLRFSFLTSTLLLVYTSGVEFSGRAEIYNTIRQSWRELVLSGRGMYFIQSEYTENQILSFLPSHEHGIVPMLFTRYGLMSCSIFVLLLAIKKVTEENTRCLDYTILCVAIFGITETSLYPTFQNPNVWVILVQILKISFISRQFRN